MSTWVYETNRLILELDSRSETDYVDREDYTRFLEASAEPSSLGVCRAPTEARRNFLSQT